MTSIVYPYKKSPRYNDIELRFSLRSIELFLSNFDQVWIVGDLPNWIQNVNHIPAKDNHSVPDRNIFDKIMIACKEEKISDDFLFFNDDHYLLNFFDAKEFPYFYSGLMQKYVANRRGDQYGRRISNSMHYLQNKGLPTKMFDIHTPILYKKQKFIESVGQLNWAKTIDGFVIKSVYANSFEIEGIETHDNKINSPPNRPIDIMSTYPHVKHSVLRFLMDNFRETSKYEKTGL